MDDYRSAFRIEVDESIVLELAIWFKRKSEVGRLHLRQLGDPKMLQGQPPLPRIEDVSSAGMSLSFQASQAVPAEKFDGVIVLVYFKLVDPTDIMGDPLSFLAGYEVMFSQHYGRRNYLGMRLRLDGVPDLNDKAVSFADAAKYGIADLTKWCDDMNRKVCGMEHMIPKGLRLDRLLRELEHIKLAQAADKREGPPPKA